MFLCIMNMLNKLKLSNNPKEKNIEIFSDHFQKPLQKNLKFRFTHFRFNKIIEIIKVSLALVGKK